MTVHRAKHILARQKKDSPLYYALLDKNYRKLPLQNRIRVYLNDLLYHQMANFARISKNGASLQYVK